MGAVAVGGTARVTTEVAAVGVKVEEQGLDVSGEQKWKKKKKKKKGKKM